MAATRQRQREALTHVLENVLGLQPDSKLVAALARENFEEIADVAGLSEEAIDNLSTAAAPISMQQRMALRNVLMWRDDLASKMESGATFGVDDWLAMDADGFTQFKQDVVPGLVRKSGSSKSTATASGATTSSSTVTQSDIVLWDAGHKRNPKEWPKFSGKGEEWFKWKQAAMAQANLDQVDELLEPNCVAPTPRTAKGQLHTEKDKCLHAVFTSILKAGQAKTIRDTVTQSNHKSGREIWEQMIEHCEADHAMAVLRADFETKISNMKLRPNTPGGALAFLDKFQTMFTELGEATGHPISEAEKVGKLCAAIIDPQFSTVIDTLQLQGATSFNTYISALTMKATRIKSEGSVPYQLPINCPDCSIMCRLILEWPHHAVHSTGVLGRRLPIGWKRASLTLWCLIMWIPARCLGVLG